MARCAYEYPDGAGRCVYRGCAHEGEMCAAHTNISQRERSAKERYARGDGPPPRKKKNGSRIVQPSRVQSAKEIIDRLPHAFGEPGDPSAPYCTCAGRTADHQPCANCGKPHFMDWRERVGQRG